MYFMHIMEFDENVYIVGKTPEECIQNAIDALEHMAVRYGGYEDYAEYLEVEHDMGTEHFTDWLESYYGVQPIKIDKFYVWGE